MSNSFICPFCNQETVAVPSAHYPKWNCAICELTFKADDYFKGELIATKRVGSFVCGGPIEDEWIFVLNRTGCEETETDLQLAIANDDLVRNVNIPFRSARLFSEGELYLCWHFINKCPEKVLAMQWDDLRRIAALM